MARSVSTHVLYSEVVRHCLCSCFSGSSLACVPISDGVSMTSTKSSRAEEKSLERKSKNRRLPRLVSKLRVSRPSSKERTCQVTSRSKHKSGEIVKRDALDSWTDASISNDKLCQISEL